MDVVGQWKALKIRSYMISSQIMLSSNTQESRDLPAMGFMTELSYKIEVGEKLGIDAVIPKFRFDYLDQTHFDTLSSDIYQTISLGLNFQIQKNYVVSLDYNWIEEKNYKLNNNRLVVRASANF